MSEQPETNTTASGNNENLESTGVPADMSNGGVGAPSPSNNQIEDAVARAKAIAAKLAQAPNAEGDGNATNGGGKRKRWAVASTTAEDEGYGSYNDNGDGSKRPKTSKKIMIPVHKNPGYNYVGLLIGPGGSKQKSLQEEAGGRVRIQIRGSEDAAGGEPLHVYLEGEPSGVEKAEQLIEELLNDTDKANAEKGRQLAEIQQAGGSGVDAGGNSMSSYRPTPVAQLIGQAMGQQQQQSSLQQQPQQSSSSSSAGIYGPSSGTYGGVGQIEEQMGIPNGVVGYIIGKGGESITSMQRRTACRVQIQKEHEMPPGSTTRIITLVAANQESIQQCRQIIEYMVAERERLNQLQSGGSGGGGGHFTPNPAYHNQTGPYNAQVSLQNAMAAGLQLVPVQVPDADVGLIIGKGGVTIRSIQERSGANIQIPTIGDTDNPTIRTVSVTHTTLEGANFAKQMIEDILRNKINYHNNNNPNHGGMPGGIGGQGGQGGANESSLQVMIPDKDVGMIIGRQGCVIREMQQKTRTRIQIPSQPTPGQVNRVATVYGPAEGCQHVKAMIERMVLEQSSQSVMTGATFTNHFSQNNNNGGGGGGGGQYSYGAGGGAAYGAYGQQYGGQQSAYAQQYAQQYGGQYAQTAAAYGQQYGAGGQAAAAGSTAAAASGKTDYSAEWAAYYAAQAAQQQQGGSATAATTAAATGTEAATSAPASADAAATPTDPTAYYDAFWRYVQYYGEEAARKYYGAWSPPVGTPNPYAGKAAPAPAPAAAPS